MVPVSRELNWTALSIVARAPRRGLAALFCSHKHRLKMYLHTPQVFLFAVWLIKRGVTLVGYIITKVVVMVNRELFRIL